MITFISSSVNFYNYYIIKTIKKNKIKIVHLNDGITSNRDGIIAAKLCGVKCIVHERQIGIPKEANEISPKNLKPVRNEVEI